nr:mannosyltransferase [Mycolicibacterium pallens]
MPSLRSLISRCESAAPILLTISVLARLASTMGYYLVKGDAFFDLRVYWLGGAALKHPATLYQFFYVDPTKGEHLPFTYPPFAAMAFYPMHFLPFGLVAFIWQVGLIAALYGSVRLSQRFIGGGSRRIAMLWTAAVIWMEAPGGGIQVGQIGIFLMLALLYAAYSSSWWVSGLLVGLGAGIKLTPAMTGFYLVGMRRWWAAAFSAVVFLGTVGLSYLVLPHETKRYFPHRMSEAGATLPVGSAWNQSWRGCLSRVMGYDVGTGPIVIVATVLTAVLVVLAWRALGSVGGERDRLASLLVLQVFGLLAAPVSWTHHWVWVVPLMIWLIHGPWRSRSGAQIIGWGWLVLMVISVPSLLSIDQPNIWQISRPWYLAWGEMVYLVAALATLAWITVTGRRGD